MTESFTIAVPDAELRDLRARLRATRWPDAVVDDWSQGTAPGVLREFIEYWAEEYDWRSAESRLNGLDHIRSGGIHAVRAGTPGATPLLLLHGWPDSFLRFERALPLLGERFELVVPSIPGYGFSDRPTQPWGPARIADQFAELMSALGHERFGVHGADIGTHIADQLAVRHPERLIALHLGDVPLRRLRALDPSALSATERTWTQRAADWDALEGAYGHQQRTKPQTIAASLNDSPAGLASWILEKFTTWSDCDGDVFSVFTREEIATNLTLYWVTQTAGSAARYYFDSRTQPLSDGRVELPTGITQFAGDLLPAPRESAERFFRVVHFTDLPRGGHFGPWEQPEAWSADLIRFFDDLT